MKVRIESLSFTTRPKVIFAQFLALFGFILISGLEARAERIEGTFRYEREDGNSTRPIAFANVEIWRFAPRALGIWTWGHDGDATTDSTGKMSKDMPFVQSGVIYAVRVFATNYAAVVWEGDTVSPISFYREPTGPDGNPMHQTVNTSSDVRTFDFNFTDPASKIHYNLAETVRRGFDYASSHKDPTEGDQIGRVNVQPQSIGTSYYNPVNDTIIINTPFVFEDIGVLHEYGHYLEDQISNFFPMPAVHNGCEAAIEGVLVNSAEHAWMEGFADYFAQVVAQSLPPGTVTGTGGTFSVFGLENHPPVECNVATGDKIEIFVAASLWDLFDGSNPTNEPFDFISQKDRSVFQIFDKELDHLGRAPTIWDFFNAWVGRGLDQAGLNRILSHNRITFLPAQTSECLQMTAPSLMFPGQTYNVTVVMRNTGETTWTSSNNYFLGSQNPQDNLNFQRSRVPLPHSVLPGGQVTFNFTVIAPSAAGVYPLQFRMVQEWVEWFGNFTPTVSVEVRALRLEVVPVSRTSTTETVRVNAYNQTTGAPVQGTVTSTVTSPASTGTNITFTRPWVFDCHDGANGRVTCTREYLQVVFTVTATGYGSASIWY
jgi:hypothetical protein